MRVLLIVGQLIGGGSEKQLAIYLENLKNLKNLNDPVEPCCWLLNSGGVWTERVKARCETFEVAHGRSRLSRVVELQRLIRRLRPDLIHCWHTYPFVYPLVSRFLHRLPIVVNLRGEITVDSDSGTDRGLGVYRWLSRVDAVVSNSRHVLGDLEARGLCAKRFFVPNGIELPPPGKPGRNGVVRVAGIGSLKPLKNWAQLIRVCGRLAREDKPVALTIYGDGPQRPELEALCRECGLSPQDVLPGFRRDLSGTLTQHDILAHCSLSEGQPNAILEGLAAGLPVVASDLVANRELRADDDLIQLFPVEDDEACRDRLAALVDDAERRAALGRRARAFVEDHFAPSKMAAMYVDIYRELLATRD